MADLARIGPTPQCRSLPGEIFVWEILVRLPPKALVRCRAVCRAWRGLASTRGYLLAHHRHQPSLPPVLLCHPSSPWRDLRAFDHLAAAAAGEVRLHPVSRFDEPSAIDVQASCDGLLLLSVSTFSPDLERDFICNPTTRQIGLLPEIYDFKVPGLYKHRPTGEYRLLLHWNGNMQSKVTPAEKDAFYVFALGCNQLRPRCIGCPPELAGFYHAPVMVRGDLHWSWWPYPLNKDQSEKTITVFDTTSESFRLMCAPIVQTSAAYLFDVDGSLGMYSRSDAGTVVDIWVVQDYESEVWSHKYKVTLPVAEIRGHEGRQVMVVHEEGKVFVIYYIGQTLFFVDTEGKLLASSPLDAYIFFPVAHRIKQSLVQHTFFSTLQGAVNAWSFI